MNKLKRFITLVSIALILTSALAGCSLKRKSSGSTLNVFNWGEYIDESILKDFTKKTGIKINYETYATNEEMYQKVKSGTNNYDLICPSDYMVERMIKEKLLKKIDFNKLPNYKNIDAQYKNLSYDPTNSYSIPYMWGTIGIIYDKKKIKDKIDSWNVLWNKKYKDEIFMSDDMRNSLGIALKKLGYSLNTKKESELNKAADELIRQKRLVNPVYIGDQVKDSMRNGEKEIAVIYSGDATVLKDEEPSRFEYVVPKEGTNLWVDTWAIPKTAKHVKEAEKFMNFLLDAKVNKKNVDYIEYATPNKVTYNMLPDDVKNDKSAYPTKKVLSKCEVFVDLGDKTKDYSDAWLDVTTE